MTVKKTIALLCIALVTGIFIACSSDIEEEEVIIIEEEEKEEMPPAWQPDWMDNEVTITVGNFESGPAMFAELGRRNNFAARRLMIGVLQKKDFPMSGRRYSVKIKIFTLKEIGFKILPVRIDKIRERVISRGHRPMTLEESVELRLQLTNQPDKRMAGTETEVRWSTFSGLLNEKDAKFIVREGGQHMVIIYHASDRDIHGEGYGIGAVSADGLFDPNNLGADLDGNPGGYFAVVTEEIPHTIKPF